MFEQLYTTSLKKQHIVAITLDHDSSAFILFANIPPPVMTSWHFFKWENCMPNELIFISSFGAGNKENDDNGG